MKESRPMPRREWTIPLCAKYCQITFTYGTASGQLLYGSRPDGRFLAQQYRGRELVTLCLCCIRAGIRLCTLFHGPTASAFRSLHGAVRTKSEPFVNLICLSIRIFYGSISQKVLLLSGPGVATITFSGVMIKAPLALADPLKVSCAILQNRSKTGPSVTYSAVPLI